MNKRLKQPSVGQQRMYAASKMPKPRRESDIKHAVLKALELLPYVLVANTPTGVVKLANGAWMRPGRLGWPDISGTCEGKYTGFYLETKTAIGKLTPDQMAVHERLRSIGAYVAVVRSVSEAMDAVREARGQ